MENNQIPTETPVQPVQTPVQPVQTPVQPVQTPVQPVQTPVQPVQPVQTPVQPVQPQYQQPVQPQYQQPVQPQYQQPVQPPYQQPVQPPYQQPVQPPYQQPVQPPVQQPYAPYGTYAPYVPGPQNPARGLSIGALIIGIVNIIFCWIPFFNLALLAAGIVSIVLAAKGKSACPAGSSDSGLATAGLVLAIIGAVLAFICVLCITFPLMGLCTAASTYSYSYWK